MISQGKQIRASRKKAGLTQTELAKHVGLSQATISAIENDALLNGPSSRTLENIAIALNDPLILIAKCSCCIANNPVLKEKLERG